MPQAPPPFFVFFNFHSVPLATFFFLAEEERLLFRNSRTSIPFVSSRARVDRRRIPLSHRSTPFVPFLLVILPPQTLHVFVPRPCCDFPLETRRWQIFTAAIFLIYFLFRRVLGQGRTCAVVWALMLRCHWPPQLCPRPPIPHTDPAFLWLL